MVTSSRFEYAENMKGKPIEMLIEHPSSLVICTRTRSQYAYPYTVDTNVGFICTLKTGVIRYLEHFFIYQAVTNTAAKRPKNTAAEFLPLPLRLALPELASTAPMLYDGLYAAGCVLFMVPSQQNFWKQVVQTSGIFVFVRKRLLWRMAQPTHVGQVESVVALPMVATAYPLRIMLSRSLVL